MITFHSPSKSRGNHIVIERREAYESAAGLLAHLENVNAPLAEMLKVADLIRIEVHGPGEELERLKALLAHLNPAWFTLDASVEQ